MLKIKEIILDVDGVEVKLSGDDAEALAKVLKAVTGKETEYIPWPTYPYPWPQYPTEPFITYTTSDATGIWVDSPSMPDDLTTGGCIQFKG